MNLRWLSVCSLLRFLSKNSNPYALTEILLMNQTICTDVMDTLNRMNFNRIKGVLLALKDYKEEYGEKGLSDILRIANSEQVS